MRFAVAHALDFGLDAMVGLDEAIESPAIMDCNSGQGFRMPPKHLLYKLLRDAVRELGGAPGAGELLDPLGRFTGRWQLEAS